MGSVQRGVGSVVHPPCRFRMAGSGWLLPLPQATRQGQEQEPLSVPDRPGFWLAELRTPSCSGVFGLAFLVSAGRAGLLCLLEGSGFLVL